MGRAEPGGKHHNKQHKKRRKFWHKQTHFIDVTLFDVDVVVMVNMAEHEILAELVRSGTRRKLMDALKSGGELSGWDTGALHGQMIELGDGFLVLLRLDKNQFRKSVGTIVHEMTHVTQYMLRQRRVPLSEKTEEVHAYLVDYLVRETLDRIYD